MHLMDKKTLDYYNKNTKEFIQTTLNADFSEIQQQFLACLPKNGAILDLGCGSGRDSMAFLKQGFQVTAADGSPEMCETVSRSLGIPVKQMLFEELKDEDKYDGIWACASLLHENPEHLPEDFNRIFRALKPGGFFYCSFKYGGFSGYRSGRQFTDLNEESFCKLTNHIDQAHIIKMWKSADVRAGKEDQQWLNVIMQRT